jgi:sugar phosphate isomerase/epimerase
MGSRDCCDLFANVTDYLKIYNRIIADGDNAKHFKMCVDTGHTNTASHYNGNPSPADMIRILGKNIVSLHLHDNDSYSDQHKMPFMGTIDWNDVFDALDEIGYNGCYNMEIVLNRYGNELAVETGAYAVKLLKNFLSKRK